MLFGFRFFSLAATLQGRIVGIIVAETKELGQVTRKLLQNVGNSFARKSNLFPPNSLQKKTEPSWPAVSDVAPRSSASHHSSFIFDTFLQVAYILSLGVCEEFRKQGIASLLLENLISHLTSEAFEVG